MQPDDGRVVTNFLAAVRDGRPLLVYGQGEQTRSFCYVSDTVAGLVAMVDSGHQGPINLGNPDEFTILELVREIEELTGQQARVEFRPLPGDDPRRRCPDIRLAQGLLKWTPKVTLREGLRRTWAWLTGPFQDTH